MTDEEIKTEEVKEEPKETSKIPAIEDAHKAASELRAENERLEKNIKELKEIKTYEALGGSSLGAPQEEVKKEETPKEYKDRVMKGEL